MAEQWTGHCETGAGIEKVNEKQTENTFLQKLYIDTGKSKC